MKGLNDSKTSFPSMERVYPLGKTSPYLYSLMWIEKLLKLVFYLHAKLDIYLSKCQFNSGDQAPALIARQRSTCLHGPVYHSQNLKKKIPSCIHLFCVNCPHHYRSNHVSNKLTNHLIRQRRTLALWHLTCSNMLKSN